MLSEGVTLFELMAMFPDEQAATKWFEGIVWTDGRCCPKCGGDYTRRVPRAKPMPYWCPDCRSYFSIRTNTAMARSHVSLQKWAFAIYLCITSLKSVSSMKLHRDIGVSQKTAWFMLHRIREAWADDREGDFSGPVEADETYFGGKAKNMPKKKRAKLTGRGTVGKTAVTGLRDRESNQVRARAVEHTDAMTLQGHIVRHTNEKALVYTDEALAYASLPNHKSVNHSLREYVRGEVHTNGIESFWSMLKRAHMGTFHKISPKHLDRYVREFVSKHNTRESSTLTQMRAAVAGLVGRNLCYTDLTADNGLCSMGRRGVLKRSK